MTNRWAWFSVLLLGIAIIGWFTAFGASAPPVPQPACDPQHLIADQEQHIADLAKWIHEREVIIAIALATVGFALVYLQLSHTWSRASAAVLSFAIVGGLSAIGAWAISTRTANWARLQQDSCLGEALTSLHAAKLSFLGPFLSSESWLWGVTADAFLGALLGIALGWTAYLVARPAFRL